MRENRFVAPVNILTPFAHAPFSWAARHTTVCLDLYMDLRILNMLTGTICESILAIEVGVVWGVMNLLTGWLAEIAIEVFFNTSLSIA